MLWDITSFSLPLASPSPPPSAIDPTVLAALITATVALLAAFISAGVAFYQILAQRPARERKLTARIEWGRLISVLDKLELPFLQYSQQSQSTGTLEGKGI